MRALSILKEEDSSDFLATIADYIDAVVSKEIAAIVGYGQERQEVTFNPPAATFRLPNDSVLIADGLSSETFDDEEEEPLSVPQIPKPAPKAVPKPAPKAATLSLKDIEKDNVVKDPKHEAVSPDNVEMSFEEAFVSSMATDDDVAPSDPEANPFAKIIEIPQNKVPRSVTPKKMPKNVKAKVTQWEGGEDNSF
jgi:hypothetical protein